MAEVYTSKFEAYSWSKSFACTVQPLLSGPRLSGPELVQKSMNITKYYTGTKFHQRNKRNKSISSELGITKPNICIRN